MLVLFKRTDIELLALVVVAFAAGCIASWFKWGYALDRPSVPTALTEPSRIESLTEFRCATRDFLVFDCQPLDERESSRLWRIDWARRTRDYVIEDRVLLPLADAHLSPESAPRDESMTLGELLASVDCSFYVQSDPGYGGGTLLSGYVAVVADGTEARKAVVSVATGEVSNDHHVFYEYVFGAGSEGWKLIRSQRFFYDIAGIEGFEWPFLHGFVLLLTLLVWAIVRCSIYVASEALTSLRRGKLSG